jgi:predicted permease
MLNQFWIDARVRLAALFARRRLHARADEELQFHLAMRQQRLIELGVSAAEARARARRELGNPTLLAEQTLDSWRYSFVDTLLQDVRYGFRTMRKNPGFTATAVLSLALGIGANTAIFRLFDALLFRALPVASPGELVLATLRLSDRQSLMLNNRQREAFAGGEMLQGLCASRHSRLAAATSGESRFVEGMLASGNCFSLLGISAVLGRMFTEADDQASEPVAVLSHGYWQHQFGASPSAIGQTITLQDRPFTIVGVAPREFIGLEPGMPADVIVPLNSQGGPLLSNPNVFWLRLLGRRKPGVSIEQVQADLAVRFARVPKNAKAKGPAPRLEMVPAGSGFGDVRMQFALPLQILMGAVGLVLLIACMNLASLLLARASGRRQEIQLRIALGAGRGRLLRQLLTESLLLSSLGGLLGLGLAWVASPLLLELISRGRTAILLDFAPEWRLLAFTTAASLCTGILFGIVPALRAIRQTDALGAQHGTRLKTGARGWSAALIVSQVAFCVIVLVSAGLLLGSLRKLRQVDAGFQKERLLVLSFRSDNYKGPAGLRLHRELYQRFTALPGVESVTTFGDVPLGGANVTTDDFSINSVGPRFFETMGIPLVSGRALNEQDALERRPVAVISEGVVRRLFPDRNPLGQHLDVFGTDREVVGVVKDARYRGLRLPAEPMVYQPAFGSGSYAIRTKGDPAMLAGLVRRELREVARDAPVWSIDTLDARVDATLVRERMVSSLCSWFGGFALLIASIGLYGRLSYEVSERTGEIGVRMALGARQSQVASMVLKDALILTLYGIAIGVPLALASARIFRSLLFEVSTTDGATFAATVAGILGVTSIAGYIPARRAAGVDPVVALRAE